MLIISSRVIGTMETAYSCFRRRTKERGPGARLLLADRGSCSQRLRIEPYSAAHRACWTDRRRRIAADSDGETAGIAGAHCQSRLVRDLVAVARPQHAREQSRSFVIAYLNPALGDRSDNDLFPPIRAS